jgi:hypothetical protein
MAQHGRPADRELRLAAGADASSPVAPVYPHALPMAFEGCGPVYLIGRNFGSGQTAGSGCMPVGTQTATHLLSARKLCRSVPKRHGDL